MKKTLTTFILSLLCCQLAAAQAKGTYAAALKKLEKDIARSVRFPRNLADSVCEAFLTVVTIPVRNNQTGDSLSFTGKYAAYLPEGFKYVMPYLKNTRWADIFPAARDKRDFDVLLPFACSFDTQQCSDMMNKTAARSRLSYELYARRNNPVAYYVLPTMGMISYGTLSCYSISASDLPASASTPPTPTPPLRGPLPVL